MVYQHQADYYATLAQADTHNDSTVFIEFILSVILQTIENYPLTQMSDKLSDIMSDTLSDKEQLAYQQLADYLQQHPHITNQQAQKLLEKSPATVRRYLKRLVDCGLLIATGKNKARIYIEHPFSTLNSEYNSINLFIIRIIFCFLQEYENN